MVTLIQKFCLICSLIHVESYHLKFSFWYFQEISVGHLEYQWVQVILLNNLILHAAGDKTETVSPEDVNVIDCIKTCPVITTRVQHKRKFKCLSYKHCYVVFFSNRVLKILLCKQNIKLFSFNLDKVKEEKQDTFVEKLVTQVIKNLQVKISNIHIRYEDDVSTSVYLSIRHCAL